MTSWLQNAMCWLRAQSLFNKGALMADLRIVKAQQEETEL